MATRRDLRVVEYDEFTDDEAPTWRWRRPGWWHRWLLATGAGLGLGVGAVAGLRVRMVVRHAGATPAASQAPETASWPTVVRGTEPDAAVDAAPVVRVRPRRKRAPADVDFGI